MKKLILVFILLFGVVSAQDLEFTTVQYGPHQQQAYDIYYPPNYDTTNPNPRTKVMLFIHGGAWHATDRQRDHYAEGFVEPFVRAYGNEMIVVNMDYKLLVNGEEGSYVLLNQIKDLRNVILSIRDDKNLLSY